MKHRLGALLGLLVLAGCQPTVNPLVVLGDCKLEKPHETAVETRSRMVVVPVRIDGQVAELMVDTGSDRTLLTPGAASRLHLDRDFEHITQILGVGGVTTHFNVRLDHFELAGLQLPLRSVAVGDIDFKGVQGGADGVLGTDVLRWFTVDLDTPDGKMTFYRPCRVTTPPWHEAAVTFVSVWDKRLGDESPRRLLLPIDLDGVPGLAMLDTGQRFSSVAIAFADRLGIDQKTLSADPALIIGGAGSNRITTRVHRFHSLRLGTFVAKNPLLPVFEMPQEPQPGLPGPQIEALLGQDVLSGRRLWFALAAEQVFISRSGSVTQP